MTNESRRRAQLSVLQAQKPKSRGAAIVTAVMVAAGVLSIAWAVSSQRSEDPAAGDARVAAGTGAPDGRTSWAEATFSPFEAVPGPLAAEIRMTEAPADRRSMADAIDTAASVAPESALGEALASPQEDVRRDGLQWALGTGVDVPQDTLQELLANDASDDVRKLALQGLTERPEATREEIRSILEAAVANPSAAVRADAARMIDRMNELELMDQRAREFRSRQRTGGGGPL